MRRIHGLSIPQVLGDVCDSTRLALLVYDMQAGIVRQIPDGAIVTEQAGRVLQAARTAGVRTFFTRHMSLPKELMGVSQYRMAMAWQKLDDPAQAEPWFLRDSPAFHIVPELAPLPSEAIFDKLAMSAFEGTPLAFALRDCGISAVAIVGIATEIGIEPTARHAADLGLLPVIVTDACGGGNPEAVRRSLDSLAFTGDALFTNTADFCEALSGR